jgi:hypothetical protein
MTKTNFLDLKGISYILYTDGDIQNVRQSQPCYGELRKYEKTHPGECTQPLNGKPGDLHSPFPAGTPTSLEVPFGQFAYGYAGWSLSEATDKLFETMFSTESPWVAGFGEVELIRMDKFIYGIRLPDLTIDPTVLVNCFKNFRATLPRAAEFAELVDAGLTENEALVALTLNNGGSLKNGIGATGAYSGPVIFSAKRFFQQKPNDLTGGYLKDRIDYNRTNMGDPFLSTIEAGGVRWQEIATKHGLKKMYEGTNDIKSIVKTTKDAFAEAIQNEPEPVIKPWIWTTTSGKTNGPVAA